MREVGAFGAKNTLGTLAENGEEIVITRHGKPVAHMIPETEVCGRSAIGAAVGIRTLAKDIKLGTFDWAEWKDFRNDGRR